MALTMVVIAGLVGWRVVTRLTNSMEDGNEAAIAEARLPVRVIEVQPSLAQGWVFDEGVSLPVNLRVLYFQSSGDITYVANLNGTSLREGDRVSQGQLLAAIDDRRQTASIDSANADVEVALNQQSQSQSSLLQAEANLERAQSDLALAESELQRYQDLFEQGVVSESDRDVYRNQVAQAIAAYEIAQQDVLSAQEGVQSAESSIIAAQARRNETAIGLEDTQLISPIDGVVAYINIQQGEYWSTQYLNTSSPQQVIETAPIVVVDPRSFEVELEIQTEAANAIRPGQRAFVVLEEAVSASQAAGVSRQDLLDIAQQQGSEGRVFAVSPSQTPDGRGTEITIRNFQQVSNLRVGGRVYVWIETVANPSAIVLPPGTVLARDQAFYAFVINEADDTVERRQLSLGVEGLSGVEVLSGIEVGESVVIEGQNRLVDGAPVEIVDREVVQ
jgi:multidrug resistance efflux pump